MKLSKPRGALLLATLTATATVATLGISGAFGGNDDTPSVTRASSLNASFEPAPGEQIAPEISVTVDGNRWSAASFQNAKGDLCLQERLPIDGGGVATSCTPQDLLFADGPLSGGTGASQDPGGDQTRWDRMWVDGFAAPDVKRLELTLTDCSTRPVEITSNGAYLVVLDARTVQNGVWPYLLTAYDGLGKVVATKNVEPSAPPTEAAVAAGIEAPIPHCS